MKKMYEYTKMCKITQNMYDYTKVCKITQNMHDYTKMCIITQKVHDYTIRMYMNTLECVPLMSQAVHLLTLANLTEVFQKIV